MIMRAKAGLPEEKGFLIDVSQPFVLWNVSDVHVSNSAIDQPQLWSINIMNGSNLHFANITVTVDDSAAPSGENWAQNTGGFVDSLARLYFQKKSTNTQPQIPWTSTT